MNKQHIQLSPPDREYLETLIGKGELKAKTYCRALALLELDRGQTYTAVSKTVNMTIGTLSTWADQYRENGRRALYDRPRSGRPVKIDGNNVPKSPHWPVVRHQKATPNGVCVCWQIKWSSLIFASKSRIRMCARS